MAQEKLSKNAKENISVERSATICLLQSGYAALDKNGNIVDRRKAKAVKAFAANRALNIPAPKKT
jgi:hypothetical protein